MTLRLLSRIARRQRWILVLGLVAAIALGTGLVLSMPRQYEARAILVVTAPGLLPAAPERPLQGPQITNPLVRNDGSLSEVARLLVTNAASDDADVDAPVQVSGGTVPTFLPATSPFLTVSATGTDPVVAVRAVTSEVALLRGQLDRFQREVVVRLGTAMTLQSVSAPAPARVGLLTSSRTPLLAALGLLGVTILVAFARTDGARLDTAGERQ